MHVQLVAKLAHHGLWTGRAANHRAPHGAELEVVGVDMRQQPLPHRGHAGREGDAFRFEQLVKRLAIQARPREHQLGAHHASRVRQAPGVDVEHGHHGQDHVSRTDIQRIRQGDGKGVQHRAAVAVQHALGVARGARGVAQRAGGVFVESGPVELVVLCVDQVLITKQAGDRRCHLGCWHVRTIGHGHKVFNR